MRAECQVPTIGRAIAALLAAVLAATPLSAQEPSAELTGCHDITVGDWIMPEPAPGRPPRPPPSETGDSALFEIPPRIEFAGTFRDFDGRLTSHTRIVVPEGALPSVHAYMWGNLVGDALALSFHSVSFGVAGSLSPSANGWSGTLFARTDTGGKGSRPLELTPADCDSPPPVPIDAMRPVPRSVELEGGLVISLGKPIPESLEMAPGLLRYFRVIGRTAGLFGTTDSISVLVGRDLEVASVRLRYPAEAHGELAARLRERLGSTRGAVESDRMSLHWRNRITDLRLTRSGSSGNGGATGVNLADERFLIGVALHPKGPLARSVKLEDGSVVTLREPLPETVETTSRGPGIRGVTGGATGLFGGADSIVARVSDAGLIRAIELFYRDADAHETLRTRLEERYGNRFHVLADTVRPGNLHRDPITEIRISRWRGSGARISLSDRRFR